jgi:prepilin-type N-terminal cleavage/methylation domain-containing protein
MKREMRGFTLIELLVVIAIIGILSSVVLASLNGARKKGRDARRVSDIKQMQLALEMYYDANSSEYPDSVCTTVSGGSCTAGTLMPTYIATVPNDPQANSTSFAYGYDNLTSASAACAVASGVCTSYVIGATLEDDTNPALNSDIDGTVGAVSCADPVYCVQP